MPGMIPWCTGEYRLSFLKEKAAEWRTQHPGRKARVRKTCTEWVPGEGSVDFGRLYVERES